MSLSKNAKIILVLPCEGSPFIWKNKVFNTKTKEGQSDHATQLQKAVRGGIETIDKNALRIHPMFNDRWRIAADLLKERDVAVYANEEGMYECSPNMAVLLLEKDYSSLSGGTINAAQFRALPVRPRPLFGDVALTMPYETLKKHIDADAMKLVRVEDHLVEMGLPAAEARTDEDYERSLGGYIYEPEDSEDCRKFRTFVKAKGWFIGSFGQVYVKPTGRPDQKEGTEYDSEDDE